SYWVWMGEFLHPAEYESRFPKVARAFRIVRRKDPSGNAAPVFRGYKSQVEACFTRRDGPELSRLLSQRPGEFARPLDHALRTVPGGAVSDAFCACVPKVSTPVLLTLLAHLPARSARAPVRVYFPKGDTTTGVSAVDQRPLIDSTVTDPIVRAV